MMPHDQPSHEECGAGDATNGEGIPVARIGLSKSAIDGKCELGRLLQGAASDRF